MKEAGVSPVPRKRTGLPVWLVPVCLLLIIFALAGGIVQRSAVGAKDMLALESWFETQLADVAEGVRPVSMVREEGAALLIYETVAGRDVLNERERGRVLAELSARLCEAAQVRRIAGSHRHRLTLQLRSAEEMSEREITCGY